VSDKLKKIVGEVGEGLVDLLTPDVQEDAPQATPTVPVTASPDGIPEYNPPKGWAPRTPPTADDEEERLAEAFGAPVDGIYAPRGDA
jgi:hypothetical protein